MTQGDTPRQPRPRPWAALLLLVLPALLLGWAGAEAAGGLPSRPDAAVAQVLAVAMPVWLVLAAALSGVRRWRRRSSEASPMSTRPGEPRSLERRLARALARHGEYHPRAMRLRRRLGAHYAHHQRRDWEKALEHYGPLMAALEHWQDARSARLRRLETGAELLRLYDATGRAELRDALWERLVYPGPRERGDRSVLTLRRDLVVQMGYLDLARTTAAWAALVPELTRAFGDDAQITMEAREQHANALLAAGDVRRAHSVLNALLDRQIRLYGAGDGRVARTRRRIEGARDREREDGAGRGLGRLREALSWLPRPRSHASAETGEPPVSEDPDARPVG
ncbi:hypothetical protein [Nocardiopsis ansamitocini]|uniref:Uncharacterized protein n=1 Tax=Nocardiopsis ansamitocini TaxID=1670832 RepID=A0A9W6P8M5_9ACTN|nr:hypothetical protein [Nocardiopsis ansamitocini]GLU48998.1 hypothetical protein Nans01_33490 [Nocardiopsis ansamitocini]